MNRQSSTTRLRKRHIMKVALGDGIFTDHISDGVCEQLLIEGWLDVLRRLPGVHTLAVLPLICPRKKPLRNGTMSLSAEGRNWFLTQGEGKEHTHVR